MEKSTEIIDSSITRELRTSSIDRQFIESSTGGRHSFDSLEIRRFSDIINSALHNDPDLKNVLPLNPNSQDIFTAVENGVLMCKLVNCAVPGTLDDSKINRKANLNIFQKTENINMAITGAKKIGCILVNMNPQLIFDKREHIILGFIWQLMRIKYVSKVNVKEMPTLLVLKESNEKESDFAKVTPEQLLLRWFNHHLENSEYSQRVTNFSNDVKNGLAYTYLLNQIKPEIIDLSGVSLPVEQRVEKVTSDAKTLGIEEPMAGNDILSANSKLNLLFCASIFEKYPKLKPKPQKIEDDNKPVLTMDSQDVIEPPQEIKELEEGKEEPIDEPKKEETTNQEEIKQEVAKKEEITNQEEIKQEVEVVKKEEEAKEEVVKKEEIKTEREEIRKEEEVKETQVIQEEKQPSQESYVLTHEKENLISQDASKEQPISQDSFVVTHEKENLISQDNSGTAAKEQKEEPKQNLISQESYVFTHEKENLISQDTKVFETAKVEEVETLIQTKVEFKQEQTVNLETSKTIVEEEDKEKLNALLGGEPEKSEEKEEDKPGKQEKSKKSVKKQSNDAEEQKKQKLMEEYEIKAKKLDRRIKQVNGFCWWCILLRILFCLFFAYNGYYHLIHEEDFSELMEKRFNDFDSYFSSLIGLGGILNHSYVITLLTNLVIIESVAAIGVVLYVSGFISQLIIGHLFIYVALYGGCVPYILANGFQLNREHKDLVGNLVIFGVGWIVWEKVCWVCQRKSEDK